MQSLSLSMSLRSSSLANFLLLSSETRVRRRRRSVIVACALEGDSGSSSTSSFLSRTQTYALLKQQLQVAAKSEDYKEAARIRDSLKQFEDEEPVLRLRRLLKEAIAEERFQGIRVQVRSVYIEGRSQPSKGLYFFAYRIRITNNSDHPVQLLRRHWIITDANGRTENVWGIGVVGEQPLILPGNSFEYSSACPLNTPNGRMEGDYEMIHFERVGSRSFNVAIAPFSLSLLGDDEGCVI
ncbi:uncharacterized protein LOC114411969 isoform X2 [Glycine soja]|uniref:Protein ApaG n=2 Tax=Glycine subgen. Soja TaxID=1462606 RepID=A0A0R0JQQ7_SOYBN|nr:protein ApaG isoform X2 [Glycine max]XP_028231523.1 uncharacterized protein LOC114411969 isoform X2 [Glycine soja]RZC10854.1 Protein ApaG isoform C [Glycine soja]|eukprot:XP_014630934.1 uncharacterized protein LOC100784413 isoform X2 [Glycine max]